MSTDEFANVDFTRPEILRCLARAYAALRKGAQANTSAKSLKSGGCEQTSADSGDEVQKNTAQGAHYYQERLF